MSTELWGQLIGAVVVVLLAVGAVIKKYESSDGSPPPQRKPADNELRQSMEEIKQLLKEVRAHNDRLSPEEIRAIMRGMDRIDDRLQDLLRATHRIEASQRMVEAMAQIRQRD